MRDEEVYSSLQQTALSLRSAGSAPQVSLIEIANEHSIDVNLLFLPKLNQRRYHASAELGKTPIIWLYRQGTSESVASLTPSDERALSGRERFSLAHELGHCFAYLAHNFHPILKATDRRRYWSQERAMDDFAGTLLVPPWLVGQWLREMPTVDATCVFRIGSWARQCRVSNEVIVRAVCKTLANIGFLKVTDATYRRSNARVFVVRVSCSGADIRLPNQHAHVHNEDFLNRFTTSTGVLTVRTCRIGKHNFNDVQVAWSGTNSSINSRRREFVSTLQLSDTSYWICVKQGFQVHDDRQGSLPFSPR